MVIVTDVDGVVANLIDEVLRRYNKDYDDSVKYEDIKAWDIALFVKPECGQKVYSYFEDITIYNNVLPIYNALYGIRDIRRNGHRLVFATTPAPGTYGIKEWWLKYYGFIEDRKDYIECSDKSLIRADVLVDDGIHNLREFRGERIIFDQPWNRNDSVNDAYRAYGWRDVVEIVRVVRDVQKIHQVATIPV